jgi:hypothetical protein
VIPTDDRKHNPQKAIEATYMDIPWGAGGDTLVLDSISFVDTTFGRGGYFHSANMHVEKFTRKGDEILYEITIEDRGARGTVGDGARTLQLNRLPTPDLWRSVRNYEVYERAASCQPASTLGLPRSSRVGVQRQISVPPNLAQSQLVSGLGRQLRRIVFGTNPTSRSMRASPD